MIETPPPLAPALRPTVSAPAPAPLLEQLATLRRENAALRGQNAAVQERIGELEDRLGQHSANSSRPPSADPPQAPARPKAPRSGGKRGGQPGHHGAYRELLPVEQVDEVVVVVPEVCRHCGQPFLCSEGRGRVRPWRHQVVELLPLAVWVTEIRVDRHRGGAVVDALLGSDFRESGQPVPEAKKWWPALWTFARAEGVEPTNNGAERGLRPAVLWRKACFGSDSAAGSRYAERLLTVVASCRKRGRRLRDFLVAASEAALRGSPQPSLLSALHGD